MPKMKVVYNEDGDLITCLEPGQAAAQCQHPQRGRFGDEVRTAECIILSQRGYVARTFPGTYRVQEVYKTAANVDVQPAL